jgi:hypothetical protein
MPRPFQLVLLIAAATLVACGGGSTPPANPIQGASPGGIWRGTDSASGLAVTGLVDETGSADFIRADDALFVGQVVTSDNSISLTADAYAGIDKTVPDGSTRGIWSMTGTIQERQTITATTTLVTAVGNAAQGTVDLTFDELSIINSAHNLYRIQLTDSCDNGSGGHNVANVSGLATLDNTASPERLVMGLTGDFPAAETWLRCDVGC